MTNVVRLIRRSPAFVRIVLALLLAVLIASPIFFPLYRFEYAATNGKTVIAAPIALFTVFTLLLPVWLRWVHQLPQPWAVLGMQARFVWGKAWLLAFSLGAAGVVLLYGVQILLGWGRWVAPVDTNLLGNLLEGLLVGVGVGLAEELLFRGWLLFELEQDYAAPIALVLNATIFAIAHYIRPISVILATWPQFVGLLLLGCALVWARRIPLGSGSRSVPVTTLGPAAGLHGGLVFAYYQFDVNDLVSATGRVPAWVTGIDSNPLAGAIGLIFLGFIAGLTYTASHPKGTAAKPPIHDRP